MLKNKMFIFVTFLCFVSANISYDGHKVYSVTPINQGQADFLNSLRHMDWDDFDVWQLSRIAGKTSHIMIAPEWQERFETTLKTKRIPYSVLISNFAAIIEEENTFLRSLQSGNNHFGFKQYHSFNEINLWLDLLAKEFPNLVTVSEIGKSYEGRPLKAITISDVDDASTLTGKKKPVVFIDGGIHAREWISSAAALYVINELVVNHTRNEEFLKKFDWIVVPTVNPDGYEYTRGTERLWHKNRGPNTNCVGTDVNHNFGYNWDDADGASSNGCDVRYRGNSSFSEPEAIALRDLLLTLKGRAKFYLTLHSYGNYLHYPWDSSKSTASAWQDLEDVAQAGGKAINAATGTRYTVGNSKNVFYATSGSSDDWAYFIAKVPIAITMELSDIASNSSGFNPVSSRILPIVQETWIGIKAMAKKVEEKFIK